MGYFRRLNFFLVTHTCTRLLGSYQNSASQQGKISVSLYSIRTPIQLNFSQFSAYCASVYVLSFISIHPGHKAVREHGACIDFFPQFWYILQSQPSQLELCVDVFVSRVSMCVYMCGFGNGHSDLYFQNNTILKKKRYMEMLNVMKFKVRASCLWYQYCLVSSFLYYARFYFFGIRHTAHFNHLEELILVHLRFLSIYPFILHRIIFDYVSIYFDNIFIAHAHIEFIMHFRLLYLTHVLGILSVLYPFKNGVDTVDNEKAANVQSTRKSQQASTTTRTTAAAVTKTITDTKSHCLTNSSIDINLFGPNALALVVLNRPTTFIY